MNQDGLSLRQMHTDHHHMRHVGSPVSGVFDNAHPIPRAELEKLGQKYRIALRIARDERWERLKCDHKGIYADDCLVERVQKHKSKLDSRVVRS